MFGWLNRKSESESKPESESRVAPPAMAARADLLWRQGSKMLERRKFDKAISAMREAFQLEPSRLDGRLNLGAALYLTGQLEEAVTHLKYVLAFEPQNTMALLNLAACLDGLGNMEESIATLEKLVADRPSWKDAHYNLAVAYFKQERYEQAIDALRIELKLNPNHEAARTLLDKVALLAPQKFSDNSARGAMRN